MESLRDQLVREIDRTPQNLLPEILDFLLFVNQKHQQDKAEILAISESALQKDWLTPEEDEAWQNLTPNSSALSESQVTNQDEPIKKNATLGDLLQFAGTWQGDDLEDCLAMVYATRSKAKFFDPESNPFA